MELTIRLTARDMDSSGVFSALERLCTCFKSEEFGSITVDPTKNMKNTEPDCKSTEIRSAQTPEKKNTSQFAAGGSGSVEIPVHAAPQPPTVTTTPLPQQTQSTVPPVVPLAGQQSFTVPQIAQAAAIFAETSEAARQQVVELIHSYGVAALADIQQDKLGEFATQLRGLGARI